MTQSEKAELHMFNTTDVSHMGIAMLRRYRYLLRLQQEGIEYDIIRRTEEVQDGNRKTEKG